MLQRNHSFVQCACGSSGDSLSVHRNPFVGFAKKASARSFSTVSRAAASDASGGQPNKASENLQAVSRALGLGTVEDNDFCIIETSDTVKDFDGLQPGEFSAHIQARRNKIFLLMEEVRRLRIRQRALGLDIDHELEQELEQEKYVSALPFLPPLSEKTLNTYYAVYGLFFAGIIAFGGLVAPILEVKLGLGGVSYREFVRSISLPEQLAAVDPIVASFCGGAVGVLSALLVVEVNNVKKQQRNRCLYCEGTGYLTCGHCVGSGLDPKTKQSCTYCAGTSKVMCTSCLCTGKQLATEHDPRASPF